MNRIALSGLVKIELPTGTLRLCDGGLILWAAETFTAKHPTFGVVSALDSLAEGVGDEVPALQMTLLPTATAAISDLVQPGFQKSRVRFWLTEYNIDTSAVIGTPDLQFDGQIDQVTLTVGKDTRELAISVVSTAERLFNRAEGNSLSTMFHKAVWPGETGHDQATGLTIPDAWGAESSVTSSNGFGMISGGFGGGMFGRGQ